VFGLLLGIAAIFAPRSLVPPIRQSQIALVSVAWGLMLVSALAAAPIPNPLWRPANQAMNFADWLPAIFVVWAGVGEEGKPRFQAAAGVAAFLAAATFWWLAVPSATWLGPTGLDLSSSIHAVAEALHSVSEIAPSTLSAGISAWLGAVIAVTCALGVESALPARRPVLRTLVMVVAAGWAWAGAALISIILGVCVVASVCGRAWTSSAIMRAIRR
jgi:hypothetical protein